jgi:hypothetical protein
MQELLPGSWGPQIVAFSKQNPLQVLAVTLIAISLLITLFFGVRGTDGGDTSFGDGDGDGGGCGGD